MADNSLTAKLMKASCNYITTLVRLLDLVLDLDLDLRDLRDCTELIDVALEDSTDRLK